MPTGRRNQQSILFSVRMPLALAQEVDAYASAHDLPRNQAFTELVRRGLNSNTPLDTLGDTPENTLGNTPGDTPSRMTELMARLDAVEARLDLMNKPQQDMRRTARLDESKHYLGQLCERGHDWESTRQSRRSRRNGGCMTCEAQAASQRRARNRDVVRH